MGGGGRAHGVGECGAERWLGHTAESWAREEEALRVGWSKDGGVCGNGVAEWVYEGKVVAVVVVIAG